MDESQFSRKYHVRKLQHSDLDILFSLCKENVLYYQYCPPFVSRESIAEDMAALPPGITMDRKYYVGYFEEDRLIAVLDLIDGYPEAKSAFIGFFMCDTGIQRCGIGTKIIEELTCYLQSSGYRSVQLGWMKGNLQAEHFWLKNGFKQVRESKGSSAGPIIYAERRLDWPGECIFRPARKEEASEVLKLYNSVKGSPLSTWNEEYPGEEEIRRDLAAGSLFVLEEESKVIGAISIESEKELDDIPCWNHTKKAGEFARVVIHPQKQGKGLAKRLIAGILMVMKEQGYEAIHISVAEKNIPAQKTYQTFGFTSVGQAKMWGNNYYLYELVL